MTELTPLELSIAMVLGSDGPAALPATAAGPLAAIEAALLGSLRRSPCLVSFSGGRDSSAVLAVAAMLARREGLPDPIPATIRAPGARAADESGWQELVVAHLGLDDWLRLEVGDELDVVGPVAQRVLRRHGLLWPFNAHFHLPLLEAARGGALVTGIGGDELLRSASNRRASAVLAARLRPKPRDLRRIALYASPAPLRRRRHARGVTPPPWLTPVAGAAVRRALAAQEVAEPRRLQTRMRHVRGLRYLRVGTAGLELLAAGAGARIAHPLLDPGVWAAVAAHAPRGGHLGRTDGMQAIFGGLLPAELLARADKAGFDEVFCDRHSRAFAERWDGVGVPAAAVDAQALREHWLGAAPLPQSFSLLQAAWLASADGVEQPLAGDGQRLPAARAPQPPHGQ